MTNMDSTPKHLTCIGWWADHDGYYDSDKFCLQVAKAACIAAFKYSPLRYDIYSVFDQAKTHTAYTADALIASRMNKNPGGAQPVMRHPTL